MFEDQIAAGMVELERKYGEDFHTHIDLTLLDMIDGARCVAGQLCPITGGREGWALEMERWGWSDEYATELGLLAVCHPEDMDERYALLTAEWRRALLARAGVFEEVASAE